MSETKDLTKLFESHRSHLHAVAYRMLGSPSESDDAVQETWLRLSSSDTSEVANFGGWLTTVVARVCLDMLRSRRSRGEEALDTEVFGPIAASERNPEQEALLADSVGVALLVVLDTLSPAERVAFVLHDVFDLPFEEIARIVDRTPDAARQLASRARRRVRRGETNTDLQRQRVVVDAFLAALRAGDFDGLLAARSRVRGADGPRACRSWRSPGDSYRRRLGASSDDRFLALCAIRAAGPDQRIVGSGFGAWR